MEKPSYEHLEKENESLKLRIKELENQLRYLKDEKPQNSNVNTTKIFTAEELPDLTPLLSPEKLTKDQVNRYGRQLIMSEIATQGQKKIVGTSVLVVGAGGLGSSSALYLAGAGIGRIGLVDFDTVEVSNLHRQIIHKESSVGIPKAVSARDTILKFNPSIECIAYVVPFSSSNALEIIKPYDIVVDATDNVATRYLLNDACVMLKKPLVSGAALRMEGQVTVYNYKGGPCYRCLFPSPPPPETVTDCANGGVLGVVPGIIGCIQALEVIKVAAETGSPLAQKLFLFDAMTPRYQLVKLRPRNTQCAVCGDSPTITKLIDYAAFCNSSYDDKPSTRKIIDDDYSVSVKDYKQLLDNNVEHLLLDVREPIQFDICALPNAKNIPLRLLKEGGQYIDEVKELIKDKDIPVYCICRRGNDSQFAVRELERHGFKNLKNVAGGVSAWAREIDTTFPIY